MIFADTELVNSSEIFKVKAEFAIIFFEFVKLSTLIFIFFDDNKSPELLIFLADNDKLLLA